ncbi:sugar phosphate isomerase/epimerase family protein [Candidatus Bipolaricaulota sp. J31]
MRVRGIGINLHPERTQGEMGKLRDELRFFQETGYDYAEIPVDAVDVVYRGKLSLPRMRKLKGILRDFDLRYTVHAPLGLDLRDQEDPEVQRDLFMASIDFTAEIGAEIFVYHYGRKTNDPRLEERLKEEMSRAASYALQMGIQICVENIEIDPVFNVLEFVREVGEENVGLALDFGHAYLSARKFGFDFFDAIKRVEPYVRHVHLTDNFGRFEEARLVGYEQYKMIPYRKLVALGKGDLHLPPGWGEVPTEEGLALLKDYEGVIVLEYYNQRYRDEAEEILKHVREMLSRITRAAARGTLDQTKSETT